MAKTFRILDGHANRTVQFVTESGESAIAAGTPVKISLGNVYVIACVDGDPTTSGGDYIVGIAATAATHTASADGTVNVYLDVPGTMYAGLPKVAGNANTQAKIDALRLKRVVLDLTTGDWTVDTAASDATTNGVLILGGDATRDEVFFAFADGASWRDYMRPST